VKTLQVLILGIITQAACLAAFVLVARTSVGDVGKPLAVAALLLGVGAIFWRELRRGATPVDLLRTTLLLVIGYEVAFDGLGVLGFHALLMGADFSAPYLLSVLRVGLTVFALYAIGASALWLVHQWWQKRMRAPLARAPGIATRD
jgi:hypothetical protein